MAVIILVTQVNSSVVLELVATVVLVILVVTVVMFVVREWY